MWIILLSLFSTVFQPTHEFYLGLIELNQNEQTNHLEVSIRLFTDDLELAMRQNAGLPLNLGTAIEIDEAPEYISNYLSDHFELKVNGELVAMNFLGSDIEDDAHWFFLESAGKVSTSGEMTIYCSFLTEVYAEQENIIQLDLGELSTRQVFTSNRQLETFKY